MLTSNHFFLHVPSDWGGGLGVRVMKEFMYECADDLRQVLLWTQQRLVAADSAIE